MNTRLACHIALAAVSLCLALCASMRGAGAAPDPVEVQAAALADTPAPDSAAATAAADSTIVAPAPDRVVLYYFHRTARCDNCLLFEAYTDSVVHAAFEPELSEGILEWRVANLDDDGNEVFAEHYALEGITLLSTVVVDNEERDFRPLDGIWWLVDDRQAFAEYVESEIIADLEAIRTDTEATHGRRSPEVADSLSLYRELVPESDGGGVDAAPSR